MPSSFECDGSWYRSYERFRSIHENNVNWCFKNTHSTCSVRIYKNLNSLREFFHDMLFNSMIFFHITFKYFQTLYTWNLAIAWLIKRKLIETYSKHNPANFGISYFFHAMWTCWKQRRKPSDQHFGGYFFIGYLILCEKKITCQPVFIQIFVLLFNMC